MKMYGYIAKNSKKSLYVRTDLNAPQFFLSFIMNRMGWTRVKAEEYIKNNYDRVEIEYNEVT